MALRRGGSVTPKLETGARHDGGDAETGFGVEVGGGLVWNDPGLGLLLDLSGRTLVAHGSDDLEDRGFAASLAFDPDPATMRGPSLTLRQDWGGEATGGLDRLFTPETLEDRTGAARTKSGGRLRPPGVCLFSPVTLPAARRPDWVWPRGRVNTVSGGS